MRSGRSRVIGVATVLLALAFGVMLGARMLSVPMVSGLRADNGYLQTQISTLKGE